MIKARIEQVLASRVVTQVTQRRVRGKRLILAYHAVTPTGERGRAVGEQSLFVSQARFAEQLDMLTSVADVVSLDHLDESEGNRPRVAITFDDGYQGAVTAAVDELVSRQLPATIFVSPGRVGGSAFWWDALACGKSSVDAIARRHALEVLDGDDERVRQWATDVNMTTCDDLPLYARPASVDELLAASRRPGVTLGSHTWSHPNLSTLNGPRLSLELDRPLDWLRSRFSNSMIPWVAYPYGLESPEVRRAAASAGYVGGLCIAGGWHRPADVSPFARPRMNVSAGMSVNGLRARVLGSIGT